MEAVEKRCTGTLFGLDQKSKLASGSLSVVLVDEGEEGRHPHYLGRLVVEGSHPDLDSKIHYLKLDSGGSGKVYLSMSEYPEESHTHFVVVFHDKSWDSLDWFYSI